jgi:hypothetical protein
MTHSRDLKGIACGVAEAFISRNNDVSGFWGIGMLYREALEHSSPVIEIDLAEARSSPNGPASQAVLSQFSAYLASRLERSGGLSVTSARLTLEFGTFGNCIEPRYTSYGDPFVCTVSLVSSTGRTYSASRAGRSAPHSDRETRSNRAGGL